MYSYLEDSKLVSKTNRWGHAFALDLEKALKEKDLNAEVDILDESIIVQNESLSSTEYPYVIKIDTNDSFPMESLEKVKEALNTVLFNKELKEVNEFKYSYKTYKMHWLSRPKDNFTFEFFVITNNNGNYSRVIIKKDQLVELPMLNKDDLDKKESRIRFSRLWEEVTSSYLNKLNMYEKREDTNHPSFVCFIESINEVYHKNFE